jgi:two-component system alkaline phosphatase synthesis response regulator PhoP
MRSSIRLKILLIVTSEDSIKLFRTILESIQSEVTIIRNGEIAIQRAYEFEPDLIICQNEMRDLNGFQVFNQLKNRIVKKGIPFFLYMDKFNKEDVLIGLEMGMDNFIISPVESSTLLNKIENQFQKSNESRLFNNQKFEMYFESTPVAKFILKNNRLIKTNNAFRRLFNISESLQQQPLISEIFNFSENYSNELHFRKCMNGLVQSCYLKNVSAVQLKDILFDVHFCNCESSAQGDIMADVVPADMFNQAGFRLNDKIMENKRNFVHTTDKKSEIDFTSREQEILAFSAQGLPIKQIAATLNVSNRTVEKHRANIMKKTGSNNIIEAIVFARKNNLLHLKTQLV